MRFSVFAATTFAAVLAFVSTASANESGLPGYSGKPNTAAPAGESCNKCHGGGTDPTVAFMGPASLTYGQMAQYSLVVTTTEKGAQAGVAATDGTTLAAVANLRESFGELVANGHVITVAGGKATFTFTVKAPTTGSSIKLWGVGLASNADRGTGGDEATQITMNITLPGTTSADAGSDASTSGSSGTDAGSSSSSSGESSSGSSGASSTSSSGSSGSTSGGTEDDAGESASSSSSGSLPGDESGGCNVSGTGDYGSALFLGAFGVIPLLARRRRTKK